MRYASLRSSLRFLGNILCDQDIDSALQDRMEVPQNLPLELLVLSAPAILLLRIYPKKTKALA